MLKGRPQILAMIVQFSIRYLEGRSVEGFGSVRGIYRAIAGLIGVGPGAGVAYIAVELICMV